MNNIQWEVVSLYRRRNYIFFITSGGVGGVPGRFPERYKTIEEARKAKRRAMEAFWAGVRSLDLLRKIAKGEYV